MDTNRATDTADFFVCATGFLHRPLFPDIEGRDSFAGTSFHSARWDHGVPYEGKRWGVIGSGASGVQITEALAWKGCEVTQFIRRAQWVHIRENPHSTWWERAKLRLPGGYRREEPRNMFSYLIVPQGRDIPEEANNIDWHVRQLAVDVDDSQQHLHPYEIDNPRAQIAERSRVSFPIRKYDSFSAFDRTKSS